MKTFAITYDLKQPGRNYTGLYDAIKNLVENGNWQHPLETLWVISFMDDSVNKANVIYEKLRGEIDDNDSVFIVEITGQDRQGWLPKSFWDWMKDK